MSHSVNATTLEQLTADPHPVLAGLRNAHSVQWVPALNGWVITGWEVARRVMRDAFLFTVDDPRFTTAQIIGPSMLSLDGAEQQRHREPFAAAFRPVEIRNRFSTTVDIELARLLDGMAATGSAELRRDLAGPLAVAVVVHALGLQEVDPTTVLAWYREIVAGVSELSAGGGLPAAATDAFAQLSDHITSSLSDRLSLLSTASGRLSDIEIVGNAAVLMFGGIETTEAMICNLVLHLLSNPEQLDLVRADPQLLDNAIEESLRLEPAAANVDRYTTADVVLDGQLIPCGDLVVVSLAGANRDPAVFDEPNSFRVERSNADQHLAFAQGPHFCLGVHLARFETHRAVHGLLDRFPGLRLTNLDPPRPSGLVFRKPERLDVEWGSVSA